jgi:Family of unknown function (DUF5990)
MSQVPDHTPVKSWREMRDWSAALLLSRTGTDVAAWNQRVAAAGLDDEPALREWLAGQGVTGYAQALLAWERFGYPDFLTADAGQLIDGQYADRPALAMSNKPGMAIEPVPGDAPAASWEMPVTVRRDDDGFDFAGPFVRGVRDDRHLGLIWGDLLADGTLRVFRGAKLRLVDVEPGLIEQAMRPGRKLIARIRLTDARGNPVCARVHPPYLTWTAVDAAG